ncbi:MAG: DUF4827 domain-containing protein [Odoribacter sp.]|nr:DUF4827 domain-containing protein [Odoribacter sp.]
MKYTKALITFIAAVALATGITSCSDDRTYAELLNDENAYVNIFLADQRVINEVPADTVFEYGPDAPFYRLDEDGQLYMQVIDPGTKDNRAKYDEQIYFRFTRYAISTYNDGEFGQQEGNDAVLNGNLSFRYNNYQISSSYDFGAGIQAPLQYLPVDCIVNIVIKSQWGMPDEMSYVQPYLYKNLRYYRPKI